MTIRRRAGLSLVLVLLAAMSIAGSQQRFTSKTIGVRVDVLVTNGHQLVRGLNARDFELRDEGVVQSVSEVDVEGMPLNLILGFDTSGSVAGERMHYLLEAGNALLAGLQPQDRVALLSFASRVRLLAPLTPSRQQIRGALSVLKAEGATSLRDAAFAALALREEDPGRTLVLIFSDGVDTSSWLRAAPVIEASKRTDAVVYAVAIAERQVHWTSTSTMRDGRTIGDSRAAGHLDRPGGGKVPREPYRRNRRPRPLCERQLGFAYDVRENARRVPRPIRSLLRPYRRIDQRLAPARGQAERQVGQGHGTTRVSC